MPSSTPSTRTPRTEKGRRRARSCDDPTRRSSTNAVQALRVTGTVDPSRTTAGLSRTRIEHPVYGLLRQRRRARRCSIPRGPQPNHPYPASPEASPSIRVMVMRSRPDSRRRPEVYLRIAAWREATARPSPKVSATRPANTRFEEVLPVTASSGSSDWAAKVSRT